MNAIHNLTIPESMWSIREQTICMNCRYQRYWSEITSNLLSIQVTGNPSNRYATSTNLYVKNKTEKAQAKSWGGTVVADPAMFRLVPYKFHKCPVTVWGNGWQGRKLPNFFNSKTSHFTSLRQNLTKGYLPLPLATHHTPIWYKFTSGCDVPNDSSTSNYATYN